MTSPLGRRIEPAVSTIGRLKRRPDFLAAAGGRRFHTELMSAQGRLRHAAGTPVPATSESAAVDGLRIGFTITKRVGHATERNRIRRRLRDAVKRAAAELPSAEADIVLVARRPALHAPFDTLVADLRRSVGAVIKPSDGRQQGQKNRPGRGKGRSGAGQPGRCRERPGSRRPDTILPSCGRCAPAARGAVDASRGERSLRRLPSFEHTRRISRWVMTRRT